VGPPSIVGEVIVVAGWLRVPADVRATYLDGCVEVVESARAAPGCIDFSIAADLVDGERINVFEQWESVDDVERFRGSGPSDGQQDMIIGAHVVQHTVASTVELT
jgi:quinol monooxygenase YgiN